MRVRGGLGTGDGAGLVENREGAGAVSEEEEEEKEEEEGGLSTGLGGCPGMGGLNIWHLTEL